MCPVKLWRTSSLNGMSLLQMKLVPSHMRHQQIGRLQLPALLASVHAAFPKYPDKCRPWVTFMCEFLCHPGGTYFFMLVWRRVAIFNCEDTGQGSTISGWRSVVLRTSANLLFLLSRSFSGSTKEPRQKQTESTKRWQMCVVKRNDQNYYLLYSTLKLYFSFFLFYSPLQDDKNPCWWLSWFPQKSWRCVRQHQVQGWSPGPSMELQTFSRSLTD